MLVFIGDVAVISKLARAASDIRWTLIAVNARDNHQDYHLWISI